MSGNESTENIKNTTKTPEQEDISSEKKDLQKDVVDNQLNSLEVKVELSTSAQNIINIMKEAKDDTGTTVYDKIDNIKKDIPNFSVEKFAENIDDIVGKFYDKELKDLGYSDKIKDCLKEGTQLAMMETLTLEGKNGTDFFTTFSNTDVSTGVGAFEGLFKSFTTGVGGLLNKFNKGNKFFELAQRVQNFTQFLKNNAKVIAASTSIPELMNPYKLKTLLANPTWDDFENISKPETLKLLNLGTTDGVDLSTTEETALQEIVKNIKMDKDNVTAIQNSLIRAGEFLDKREKYKNSATGIFDKIKGMSEYELPFGLGTLGGLFGLERPADILGKRKGKKNKVLNFVLNLVGIPGGVEGLHEQYVTENLTKLMPDDQKAIIKETYQNYSSKTSMETVKTNDDVDSTCKELASNATISALDAATKAKIPPQYALLKSSILTALNNDKLVLDPDLVLEFDKNLVTTKDNKDVVVNTSLLTNTTEKEAFIDDYLKYMIPFLAGTRDKYINSENVTADSFALTLFGALVGGKYFRESINLGLTKTTDFTDTTKATPETAKNIDVVNGQVDFSKGDFTKEQKTNINYLIDEMVKKGITNPYTQIGMLSVISKECNFMPQSEVGYLERSNSDIRNTFGDRITLSDPELDALKKKGKEEFDKRFFDMVYGKNATTALGWDTGNTEEGDGYKYRGRGFNQITFKANYKKYGKEIGEDLVETPDLLNNPAIAAKAALAFFTDGNKGNALSTLTFDNKEKATTYFANINAGGHISTYNSSALVASQKFDVVSKDLDATTKISTSTLA